MSAEITALTIWARMTIWHLRSEIPRYDARLDPLSTVIKTITVEGKRTVERDVVCYSLRGITEICHLLRGVSYWNPLKSRSTASYRQSDRSWNRIKANSGHFVPCWVRSILSELQGSRSDQLAFGGRKFSYETVSTTYTAIRRIVDNSSHSIRSTLFNRVNPDRVTLCGTHPPGRRLLSF